MDETKRLKKERQNDAFMRGELGALLKLFSSLGVTVAVGIFGFFFLGMYIDKQLQAIGLATRGIPRIVFLLAGVGLSVYWAYLRIARHLERYEPKDDEEDEGAESTDSASGRKRDAGK